MKAPGAPEGWQPVSGRQRLLIALLAVATAAGVVLALTGRPGGAALGDAAKAAKQAACRASEQSGCVGGMAEVYAVPAAPAR